MADDVNHPSTAVDICINGAPPSAGNPLPVGTPTPAAPITGQAAVTTSAVSLGAQALLNGVVVKALTTNGAAVYIGAAGVTVANGYPLQPGEAISFAVANLSSLYIISAASTTDKVAWAGN